MSHGPARIDLKTAASRLARAPGRIYLGVSAAEPVALLNLVDSAPGLWAGRLLTGAFIPGVNDRPPPEGATFEGIFATAGLARAAGFRHLPISYAAFWRRLARPGLVSHAVLTLPPPRADGTIGLGLGADFAPPPSLWGPRCWP